MSGIREMMEIILITLSIILHYSVIIFVLCTGVRLWFAS